MAKLAFNFETTFGHVVVATEFPSSTGTLSSAFFDQHATIIRNHQGEGRFKGVTVAFRAAAFNNIQFGFCDFARVTRSFSRLGKAFLQSNGDPVASDGDAFGIFLEHLSGNGGAFFGIGAARDTFDAAILKSGNLRFHFLPLVLFTSIIYIIFELKTSGKANIFAYFLLTFEK